LGFENGVILSRRRRNPAIFVLRVLPQVVRLWRRGIVDGKEAGYEPENLDFAHHLDLGGF
jgi:hypothetical protein